MLRLGAANGSHRAHLRHAPAVMDAHAEVVAQRPQNRLRTRRAADRRALQRGETEVVLLHVPNETEPDGRHPRRGLHLLALEQLVEAPAVVPRPGKHQLGTGQRRRIRNAPRVDVEHRNDGEDDAVSGQGLGVGHAGGHRVQHRRAVAEQHALRVPRGARGIAQRRRGVLVEFRPFVVVAFGVEHRFVTQQVGHGRCRHVRAVGHGDPGRDLRARRREHLHERQERKVEKNETVVGVIDDVLELVAEEPRVDRVQHRTHARHAVVELEVPVAIPCERPDAFARGNAKPGQCVGEPARAAMGVAVGIAMNRSFDGARHDFRIAVVLVGVADKRRDQQRPLHHQP